MAIYLYGRCALRFSPLQLQLPSVCVYKLGMKHLQWMEMLRELGSLLFKKRKHACMVPCRTQEAVSTTSQSAQFFFFTALFPVHLLNKEEQTQAVFGAVAMGDLTSFGAHKNEGHLSRGKGTFHRHELQTTVNRTQPQKLSAFHKLPFPWKYDRKLNLLFLFFVAVPRRRSARIQLLN